jgi:glutamate formiminotransferase
MDRIIECVPNFSEGRNPEVIDRIAAAIADVKTVKVLGRESDKDHNRSVITFIGPPETIADAAFAGVAKAAELIDLTGHTGEHPRMGAADVVPFVPVRGVEMEDCVKLARELGRRVGEELHIPVFLYEEAATKPERRNLANVRRGQFEGLRDLIGKDPQRKPDFGPEKIHPTAGAVAIGAREFLIAYNVNLASDNLALAKEIAKKVRESSGGLPCVKALGLMLKELNVAQVSMNLTNFRITPVRKVFDAIRAEAEKAGEEIRNSELIGLVPRAALSPEDVAYLKIESFDPNQIIENRLDDTD